MNVVDMPGAALRQLQRAEAAPPQLRAIGLGKDYLSGTQHVTALQDVNLTIEKGQF